MVTFQSRYVECVGLQCPHCCSFFIGDNSKLPRQQVWHTNALAIRKFVLIQCNDEIIHCCFELAKHESFAVGMSVLCIVHVMLYIGKWGSSLVLDPYL